MTDAVANARLSRDDFEQSYAARSGLSVAELREYGINPEPCACGDALCRGWKMVTEHERRIGKALAAAHDGADLMEQLR